MELGLIHGCKTSLAMDKDVIIREARAWAAENGYKWPPSHSHMSKEWLMDKLMTPTERNIRHSYQGRMLAHIYYEQEFKLDVKTLRLYLDPK